MQEEISLRVLGCRPTVL